MYLEIVSDWIAHWPNALQITALAGVVIGLLMFRYFAFAGTAFGLGLLIERFAPWRRLQNRRFTRKQIFREIAYSMSSLLVFVGVVGIIIALTRAGYTQLYMDVDAFGWLWFLPQIPLILLIQDWYFYWMHRIVHMSPLYDRIHKTHHLSTNPSAFSAFAFHPLEALLEIAIFVVLVVIMPLHINAVLIAGIVSLAHNVYGHLGYEIMPRFIAKSALGSWLNTSAYHNQHHRTYRYNYGLYTVIWDRLHGTMHPKAGELFDRATTKPVRNGAPKSPAGRETHAQ